MLVAGSLGPGAVSLSPRKCLCILGEPHLCILSEQEGSASLCARLVFLVNPEDAIILWAL